VYFIKYLSYRKVFQIKVTGRMRSICYTPWWFCTVDGLWGSWWSSTWALCT